MAAYLTSQRQHIAPGGIGEVRQEPGRPGPQDRSVPGQGADRDEKLLVSGCRSGYLHLCHRPAVAVADRGGMGIEMSIDADHQIGVTGFAHSYSVPLAGLRS